MVGMAGSSGFGSNAGVVRRILLAATALAAACVVALAAGDLAGARAGSTHSAGAVSESIPWGPCDRPGEGLQCARIRVPLDWDRPNGRTIRLAVIRHLASKPEQRIGTALANPGGPGDTGVGLVSGDPDGIDALVGGRFDVVSWDPRGTHASSRVRCFENRGSEERFWAGVSIPTTRAASKRYRRKSAALARRCGRVSGRLLPHISTADTARDMDYLRQLVGEEKLTYIGFSYGTFLGQTYANMFPDRVRAMLLDGIVDPVRYSKSVESSVALSGDGTDRVFDQFLSLCEGAGPARCALAGGSESPAERFERLVARLKRAPIPAPGAKPPLTSREKLSYSDLLLSQFNQLRGPDLWPGNARNLAAALGGDGSGLETEAGSFLTPAGFAGATTSAAIQCADAPARNGSRSWPRVIKRFTRISRFYGPILGWWQWAPCASWPVRGEDTYRGPWDASTPNPILLIGTTGDPATDYANAVRSEQLLGNAVLLTHEGYGHVSFRDPSACIQKGYVDYLTELITPPRGTACRADQQPFDPDFG
jgi:pimeloyl-ACP methyl ester carboxylesterase